MTAETITKRGRSAAEAIMVDACTLVRPTPPGRGMYETATMTYGNLPSTSLYTGKCRVRRYQGPQDILDEAAEKPVGVGPYVVQLPVTVDDVRLDDVITVTASLDPALVGLTLIVRSAVKGTHMTARRLLCDEVTL